LFFCEVGYNKKQQQKTTTIMTMSNGTTEIFSTQEMRWIVVEKFKHKGVSYYYSPAVLGGPVDDGEVLYDAGTEEYDSTVPCHSVVGVWDDSGGKVVDYTEYMASYRSYMASISSCK
jgi:hypothetical protein